MSIVLSPAEISFLQQSRDYLQLPDDYLVADLETSGFSRDNDFIIEVAIGHVKNRQLVSRQVAVLNWCAYDWVDQNYLASQLSRIGQEYAKKDRSWRYNLDVLRDEGHDPILVLQSCMAMLQEALDDGQLICGHGFWRFDREMLNAHCRRFLNGYELHWHPEAIFDSGLLTKAIQLGKTTWPGETRDAWFTRIDAVRAKGVLWALDGHCMQKYDLQSRYQIDPQQCHQAGYDIYLCHLIVETVRHLLETA